MRLAAHQPCIQAWAPCRPVPWARPRFDGRSGRTFTSPASKRGADALASLLGRWTPREPYEGALTLRLVFALPSPKRRDTAKGHGHPHAIKPDLDNLAKQVMDVLSRLSWWHDDAQVSSLTVSKLWAEGEVGEHDGPGVHVFLSRTGSWEARS